MFTYKHYVPILKGKEGEFVALQKLDEPTRKHITPLVEIMDFSPAFLSEEQRAKRKAPLPTGADHMKKSIKHLIKTWHASGRIFIDLHLFDLSLLYKFTPSYVRTVYEELITNGVEAVPVVNATDNSKFTNDIKHIVQTYNTGIVARLRLEEMYSKEYVERIQSTYELPASKIDLVLDFGSILTRDVDTIASWGIDFIDKILYQPAEWRTLTLASGAFPVDLSKIDKDTESSITRNDWLVWKRVAREVAKRKPTFGDYSIAHPDVSEIKGVPDVSASIRYTAKDSWLILRGRGTKDVGWDGIRLKCKDLISKGNIYDGASFSWGDKYIYDCAAGTVGTGGSGMWRKVANNHHIEKVCSQISSQHVP